MDGGKGKFVVNPYLIPSKWNTIARFFKQLRTVPRLKTFAVETPDGCHNELMTWSLFEFIDGEPTKQKKDLLEECLFEFRKVLINDRVSYVDIAQAASKEERIKLLQLDPLVVRCMYLQLWCLFCEHGVQYDFSDFGIGKNENFLFTKFYCEDHPALLLDDMMSTW